MGRMQIHSQNAGSGSAFVTVEEYKRPKFQVTLDSPKTAPKLNAEVQVPGKAMAYTGAAINNAKVKFRVVREVRYPDWWGWRFWWRQPSRSARKSHTVRPRPKPMAVSSFSSTPNPTDGRGERGA